MGGKIGSAAGRHNKWLPKRFWPVLGLVLVGGMACNLLNGITPASSTPTAVDVQALSPVPATAVTTASDTEPPLSVPATGPGPQQADSRGLIMVYTKAGGLWRWQDGKAQALPLSGAAYAPRLSPDEKLVAFLRPADEFHIELWVAGLDGSRERKLVSIADLAAIGGGHRDASAVAINPYSFAWVPGGGQRLAFNTHQALNGPGLSLLDDLNIVDVESGKIQNLFLPGTGGEFVFSPDGSQVAISKSDQILLSNSDGSNYRQVMTYPLILTYSEYRYYALPKWSPDGSFLRVVLPPVDALADPTAQTALWRIPVDGSPPVQEGGVAAVPFFDAPVVYSPDLQRVAFIQETGEPGSGQRALHLATYDGGGDWEAAKAPMLQFGSWAPESRKFVYTAGDEMAVFAASLDAVAQALGEQCSGAVEVRWLDDRRLVCTSQSPGAFDLMLIELNGGALQLDTITGDAPSFDLAR